MLNCQELSYLGHTKIIQSTSFLLHDVVGAGYATRTKQYAQKTLAKAQTQYSVLDNESPTLTTQF